MIIIGIDPGASGAMVAIYPDHSIEYVRFKDTEGFSTSCYQIKEFIERTNQEQVLIYLERVHSMPGQGVASVFSFGRAVGIIEGMLKQGNLYNYELVEPQKWQSKLGLTNVTGKTTFKNAAAKKSARKKAYLEHAKKLFPKYKDILTLDLADAVLIAEYGYGKTLKEFEV